MANFNSAELAEEAQQILGKLDEGVTLETLQSIVDIPQLSEFSQLAEQFLPKNLVKFGEDGKVGLPSLTELQQSLNKGLTDIKGYLEQEITGIFNELKGQAEAIYKEAEAVFNEGKQILSELSDIKSVLESNNSKVADLALETLNGATGLNLDTQMLGKMHQTVTNTIDSFTKLSPKQLRDLANPDFYKNAVNVTLNTSLDVANTTALLATGESLLNDQIDGSGYIDVFKKTLKEKEDPEKNEIKIAVERKVYWGKGEGATPEAFAKKSNSGNQLKSDYSLAVDNSNILLGAKVKFSDDKKEREAVDTATPSKGLSPSGTYPVIGIYFDDKQKAMEYTKKYPQKYVTAIMKLPDDSRKKQASGLKKKNKDLQKKLASLQDKGENMKKLLAKGNEFVGGFTI